MIVTLGREFASPELASACPTGGRLLLPGSRRNGKILFAQAIRTPGGYGGPFDGSGRMLDQGFAMTSAPFDGQANAASPKRRGNRGRRSSRTVRGPIFGPTP